MYDSYIMKRTQIYLADAQAEELGRRARGRGVTASRMIREAIDEYLAAPDDEAMQLRRFKKAAALMLGSIPSLPDGVSYVRDLRSADREHEAELERRRRQ